MQNQRKWDKRFFSICDELSTWSSCLSRKIGAILVRNRTIIATGYNGPPRGIPHCGVERNKSDVKLFHRLRTNSVYGDNSMCPRQRLGYGSGGGLELCTAAHAEDNCISNAARTGVVVAGSTMYVSCGIPCKDCLKKIINSGVDEVVCQIGEVYDDMTRWLVENSKIGLRLYDGKEETDEDNISLNDSDSINMSLLYNDCSIGEENRTKSTEDSPTPDKDRQNLSNK